MTRRIALAALGVAAFAMIAMAGDMSQSSTGAVSSGNVSMETIKAQMMKCAVCKHIAMHMDEIGPIDMESVRLNDGVAINHWVRGNDPKQIAAMHSACEAANTAGKASMTMTDEQAKTQLCDFCQAVRMAIKSGATLSSGETHNGDMMILTSTDPAVQGQLAAIQQKCSMMAAVMDKPAKITAQK